MVLLQVWLPVWQHHDTAQLYRAAYNRDMPDDRTAQFEHLSTDERVRITRWTFASGQATGMHIHEFDYTALPITGGQFRADFPDGTSSDVTQVAGQPYSRLRGVQHNVCFVGEGTAQFVEIEYLD
jgi:quercetin dioxygenase-like cupin family protein